MSHKNRRRSIAALSLDWIFPMLGELGMTDDIISLLP